MFRKIPIKLLLFYILSIGFILLDLWFVIKMDSPVIHLLPFVFLILLFVFYSFDKILYLVVLFVPLSIPLSEIKSGLSFNMYLPTEPLLFGLLLIFLLKVIHERGLDRKVMLHPVSIIIYISLIWILVTSLTSSMPVVSIKFFLSRIWFIVGFYFLVIQLFNKNKNLERFIWLYAVGLTAVIIFTTYKHLAYGLWDKQAAHFVMNPLYNDHTAYGAALAMFIPFFIMFTFNSGYSGKFRFFSAIVLAFVLLGFILSYSRAAWISLVLAVGILIIIKLRINFYTVITTLGASILLFFLFQEQIIMKLEQNNEQSSANFVKHISSVSNITTDASNLERINRWSCAIRMFEDKPWVGFGPGTYMFKYAPYQLTKDRTIISTNSADGGNAHSEYLNAMAETGFAGLLIFLALIGCVVFTALRAYTNLTDKRLKALVLTALISLFTYYFHSFLNNFLDTDKLSAPFWGFTAMIVFLDIYARNQKDSHPVQ